MVGYFLIICWWYCEQVTLTLCFKPISLRGGVALFTTVYKDKPNFETAIDLVVNYKYFKLCCKCFCNEISWE